MEVKIEAPWTDGEETFEGALGMMAQFKKQLLYFQEQNDTESIRNDIAGYDLILKSKSEDNAQNFLKFKVDSLCGEIDVKFKNNLEVVKYLKEKGEWKDEVDA